MTRASEAFDVQLVDAPRRARAVRFVVTLVASVANLGGGPMNPGGRRVVITDRKSGKQLAVRTEHYGDDYNSLVDAATTDLHELDVADFARRWIGTGDPTP